jgi:transcriptional repressor NF-X1
MPCFQVAETSTRMTTSMMARMTMRDGQSEGVDVSELVRKANENKLCRLDCDDKCAQIERNKQLASALGLKDVDVEAAPQYPESLKQYAAENAELATEVYDCLVNLVKTAKASSKAFQNHNFPPMRADQRQFIHEMAEFFACKTTSLDHEPHRSVVVKALKERCRLPSVSILDVIKKKNSWLVLSQKGAVVKFEKPAEKVKVEKPAWKARPVVDCWDCDD